MPELPEVETVRVGLNRLTTGRLICGGQVLLERTLAYPPCLDEFWEGITGTTIVSWQRRGKYLLAKLQSNQEQSAGWLGVHLRMTGQLLWVDQNSNLHKHTRLRWFFAEGKELRFVDTRTFGKVWWVPDSVELNTIITGLEKLGPEPLSSDFSIDYLVTKLAYSQRKIKTLLLDQSVVAGIGNIYADEALFKSGIKPEKTASTLKLPEITKLHQEIKKVLNDSIAQGGTTFSDFVNVVGINGNYGKIAWVYRREGQPCRVCGSIIKKMKLAGRSAHFCPQCQK